MRDSSRHAAAALALLLGAAFSASANEDLAAVSSSFFDGNGMKRGAPQLSLPPAPKAPDQVNGQLLVRLFDGARKPFSPDIPVFLRVFDGNQKEKTARYLRGPEILVQGLPIYDNFGDNYRVIAFANGHKQAGAAPVPLKRGLVKVLELMLPPNDARFDFSGASWDGLLRSNPTLLNALSRGARSEKSHELARERWERLLAEKPESAANLLNIAAAMEQIAMGDGTALEHLEGFVWDETMARDRFWAYARAELLTDLKASKSFKSVKGEGVFHPGAIESFKQQTFEGGNVQITFHQSKRDLRRGADCVLVEIDIDLHKDPLAHALLEVVPNLARHGQTDPKAVYQVRWTAGRRAGVEWDPLYTLVGR